MPFVLPIWVYWSFYNLLPSPLFCQRLMDIASKIGPFCGKMHQKRTFAKVLGQNRIADQFQAATISFLQLAMPYSLPAPTLSNFRRSQIRLHSNSEITHLKFNQATLPPRASHCQEKTFCPPHLALLLPFYWRPQNVSVAWKYLFKGDSWGVPLLTLRIRSWGLDMT